MARTKQQVASKKPSQLNVSGGVKKSYSKELLRQYPLPLLEKEAFQRFVKERTEDLHSEVRWDQSAIELLRETAVRQLVELLQDASIRGGSDGSVTEQTQRP